jgi:hypothetical protein
LKENIQELLTKITERYSPPQDTDKSPIILPNSGIIDTISNKKTDLNKPSIPILGEKLGIIGIIEELKEILAIQDKNTQKAKLESVTSLLKSYTDGIKNKIRSFVNVDNNNMKAQVLAEFSADIAFFQNILLQLETLKQGLEKELKNQTLEQFLTDYNQSENPIYAYLINKIQDLLKKDLPPNPYPEMQTDWGLVKILQEAKQEKGRDVKKEVEQFCLDLLEKIKDLEPVKTYLVLPQIYTLILGYLTDDNKTLYTGFDSPKLTSKLIELLSTFSSNYRILEPLHHTLNLLKLNQPQLERFLEIMTKPGVKESGITVSLLNVYNQLKAVSPENKFFEKQEQIGQQVEAIFAEAKEQGYYDVLIARLMGQSISGQKGNFEPSTNPSSLILDNTVEQLEKIEQKDGIVTQKVAESCSLVNQLVLPPNIPTDPILKNSKVGLEIEGNKQPGQETLDDAPLKIPLPPEGFDLGLDGSEKCLEVRTVAKEEYLTLISYFEKLPDLMKYLQSTFSNPSLKIPYPLTDLKLGSLHAHFDKELHPNVPEIYEGRNNSPSGIGDTWESRGHGITPFVSPEALFTFLHTMITSKPLGDYSLESLSALVFQQNIYPLLFELDPLIGLYFQQNDKNLFNNRFIFRYIDENLLQSLVINGQAVAVMEIVNTSEFQNTIKEDPSMHESLLGLLVINGQAGAVMSMLMTEKFQEAIKERPSIYEYLLRKLAENGQIGSVMEIVNTPKFQNAILETPAYYRSLLRSLIENSQFHDTIISILKNEGFQKVILMNIKNGSSFLDSLAKNSKFHDTIISILKTEAFQKDMLENPSYYRFTLNYLAEYGNADAITFVISTLKTEAFQKYMLANPGYYDYVLKSLVENDHPDAITFVISMLKTEAFQKYIQEDMIENFTHHYSYVLKFLVENSYAGAVISILKTESFQNAMLYYPSYYRFILRSLAEYGNADAITFVISILKTKSFQKDMLENLMYYRPLFMILAERGNTDVASMLNTPEFQKVILNNPKYYSYLSDLFPNSV